MIVYIISSIAYFDRLLSGKAENPKIAPGSVQFATRDWFVAKKIKEAGYSVIIFDNLLDKEEVEKITRKEMEKLCSWYQDEKGSDFSIYRDVSLADCARQHFYHDVFSHIFSFIPNVLKLIKDTNAEKVIYEYHSAYRNSLSFNMEDKIMALICRHLNVDFSCIMSNEFSAEDLEKYEQSQILKKNKSSLLEEMIVSREKGICLDIYNYLHIIKYRLRRVFSGKKSVFTDSSRGTDYFRKNWQNKYNFITSRKTDLFDSLLKHENYLLKAYKRKYKKNNVSKIKKQWDCFIANAPRDKFRYFGIDISDYLREEVIWVIENIFPVLMELIDKAFWLFDNVKISFLLRQSDTTLNGQYIFYCAKVRKIPNFVHPDGMRNTIEPSSRFADYKLLFSESMKKDFSSERFTDKTFVVGDPWLQKLYRRRKGNSPSLPEGRKIKILIGVKTFIPQVVGNHWSSGMCYLHDIFKGIYPLKNNFDVIVRTFPGVVNLLELVKKTSLCDLPFDIQNAEDVPYADVIDNFDIFILSWSTTVYEAAIMNKIVIYYSDTNVFNYAPFDGKSGLTTAETPEQITCILQDIINNNIKKYFAFNDRKILERYTGPLESPDAVLAMDKAISEIISR